MAAPRLATARKWIPHLKPYSKQHLLSGMETLWDRCSMEEVGLDLGQVDPHGTRQHQPRGESWWLLRFDNKRRQTDAQQQSQSPNRASGLAGKTWSIVDMEGSLGDGRKPNQLHHHSHLRLPVVWRRSFLCPLSNPCNTESHSHRLQNQRVPGPLHLETQQGPKTTGDPPGRKENYQQCPPSPHA